MKQYKEQLVDVKGNLHDIHNELLSLGLDETMHSSLERLLFDKIQKH